jgi:hypothetical protein
MMGIDRGRRAGEALRRMRPPWRRRGRAERRARGSRSVVAEAWALLDGRAIDAYTSRGEAIPDWAWLNCLAHQPPEAILAMAVGSPMGRWSRAAAAIANDLRRVDPRAAEEIRNAVLVPAELDAFSHSAPSPDGVARAVRRYRIAYLAPADPPTRRRPGAGR